MTDSYRVYTKVRRMVKVDYQGQMVRLARLISEIALSRKAQVSAMSSEIPTQTQEESIEMRLRVGSKMKPLR